MGISDYIEAAFEQGKAEGKIYKSNLDVLSTEAEKKAFALGVLRHSLELGIHDIWIEELNTEEEDITDWSIIDDSWLNGFITPEEGIK